MNKVDYWFSAYNHTILVHHTNAGRQNMLRHERKWIKARTWNNPTIMELMFSALTNY